jgi:hypothetical protein
MGICDKIQQFFRDISIKESCVSSCCITIVEDKHHHHKHKHKHKHKEQHIEKTEEKKEKL